MAVALVGATGGGKSELALDAAGWVDAEIINADSMQLYKGMDIGTAKVPPAERRGIAHHQLDVLLPDQPANVAAYQREAGQSLAAIAKRGKIPLVVGGSGLYVSTLLHDLEFAPADARLRQSLEEQADAEGLAVLYSRLRKLCPAAAVDAGNRKRIIRSLEVLELTGKPPVYSFPVEKQNPDFTVINLVCDQEVLRRRLYQRVKLFWQQGLLEEVRFLQGHYQLSQTARYAIGYRQAIAQLAGELTEEQAQEETWLATVKLANRQVKWFKRYANQHCIDVSAGLSQAVRQLKPLLERQT